MDIPIFVYSTFNYFGFFCNLRYCPCLQNVVESRLG